MKLQVILNHRFSLSLGQGCKQEMGGGHCMVLLRQGEWGLPNLLSSPPQLFLEGSVEDSRLK